MVETLCLPPKLHRSCSPFDELPVSSVFRIYDFIWTYLDCNTLKEIPLEIFKPLHPYLSSGWPKQSFEFRLHSKCILPIPSTAASLKGDFGVISGALPSKVFVLHVLRLRYHYGVYGISYWFIKRSPCFLRYFYGFLCYFRLFLWYSLWAN